MTDRFGEIGAARVIRRIKHLDGEIHENWDHGFHYIQHTNYNSVMAVPSDMYVQGYDGKGVAKLRLWQAKAPDFDMSSFSLGNYNTAMSKNANAELISKVLYRR